MEKFESNRPQMRVDHEYKCVLDDDDVVALIPLWKIRVEILKVFNVLLCKKKGGLKVCISILNSSFSAFLWENA